MMILNICPRFTPTQRFVHVRTDGCLCFFSKNVSDLTPSWSLVERNRGKLPRHSLHLLSDSHSPALSSYWTPRGSDVQTFINLYHPNHTALKASLFVKLNDNRHSFSPISIIHHDFIIWTLFLRAIQTTSINHGHLHSGSASYTTEFLKFILEQKRANSVNGFVRDKIFMLFQKYRRLCAFTTARSTLNGLWGRGLMKVENKAQRFLLTHSSASNLLMFRGLLLKVEQLLVNSHNLSEPNAGLFWYLRFQALVLVESRIISCLANWGWATEKKRAYFKINACR